VAIDPSTGSGAYMISGGMGGASSISPLEHFLKAYQAGDPTEALDEFFTYCGVQPFCGLVDPLDFDYDDLGQARIESFQQIAELAAQHYVNSLSYHLIHQLYFAPANLLAFGLTSLSSMLGDQPDKCSIFFDPAFSEAYTNISGYYNAQVTGAEAWEKFHVYFSSECYKDLDPGEPIDLDITVEHLPDAYGEIEHNPIYVSASPEEAVQDKYYVSLGEGKKATLSFKRSETNVKKIHLAQGPSEQKNNEKVVPIENGPIHLIYTFDDGPTRSNGITISVAKYMRETKKPATSVLFFVMASVTENP